MKESNMLRKLFSVLPVLALSFVLVSCGAGTKVGSLIDMATTTVTNPVSATNIYQAENAYAATLTLAVDWRKTCYSASYATLMANPVTKVLCQNRRSTVRKIQAAKAKASALLAQAEAFVRNNPTLSAATVVTQLWGAVSAFRNAVPGAPTI